MATQGGYSVALQMPGGALQYWQHLTIDEEYVIRQKANKYLAVFPLFRCLLITANFLRELEGWSPFDNYYFYFGRRKPPQQYSPNVS